MVNASPRNEGSNKSSNGHVISNEDVEWKEDEFSESSVEVKIECVLNAAMYGRLDCLNYLVEEAKVPLRDWRYVAYARYHEQPECVNYLLEKECQQPTDEEYAWFVEEKRLRLWTERNTWRETSSNAARERKF